MDINSVDIKKIKEIFKGKEYDDKTLEFIGNFIEEFDVLYGKYVPREEVIKRINENLDNVVWDVEMNNNSLGQTSSDDRSEIYKKINISNRVNGKTEEQKEVFFHEMIHVLTSNYHDIDVFGLETTRTAFHEKNGMGHGLTEGCTELLTRQRNKKFNPQKNINAYPILTDLTEKFEQTIGEQQFMDMLFYDNKVLKQLFMDESREPDISEETASQDYINFINAFDVIWNNEDELYHVRNCKGMDKFAKNLLEELLGVSQIQENIEDSLEFENAKNTIVGKLLTLSLKDKELTKDEFKKVCEKAKEYEALIINGNGNTIGQTLTDIYINMPQSSNDKEQILEEIDEKTKELIQKEMFKRDFFSKSEEEKIKILANIKSTEEYQKFKLGEDNGFLKSIGNDLFKDLNTQKNDGVIAKKVAKFLIGGYAQKIIDEKLNVNRLAFQCNAVDIIDNTFDIYYTDIDDKKYLGQYQNIYNEETEKYEIVENKKRRGTALRYVQSNLDVNVNKIETKLQNIIKCAKLDAPEIIYKGTKDYTKNKIMEIEKETDTKSELIDVAKEVTNSNGEEIVKLEDKVNNAMQNRKIQNRIAEEILKASYDAPVEECDEMEDLFGRLFGNQEIEMDFDDDSDELR